MKKISIFIVVAALISLCSCKKNKDNDTACPLPAAGAISGPQSVNTGSTITLSDTVVGGAWSSGNTANATVGSTGVVTGVAAGTASIIYTTTNSCGSSTASYTITVNAVTIAVGQSYGGGIIAYVLQVGDPGYDASVKHGFIAAPADQSAPGLKWHNGPNVVTSATGANIGTGLANTNAIITAQGTGSYAASVCRNLNLGGYTDWYLPSKDELNKLYVNRVAIGGFGTGYYWSSTEYNLTSAWAQLYSITSWGSESKNSVCSVRAIRSF